MKWDKVRPGLYRSRFEGETYMVESGRRGWTAWRWGSFGFSKPIFVNMKSARAHCEELAAGIRKEKAK